MVRRPPRTTRTATLLPYTILVRAGVTVDEEGFVKASFSNGDNQVLGKIALANFSNPTGLRQLGNSTWASSGISGEPAYGEANSDGLGALRSEEHTSALQSLMRISSAVFSLKKKTNPSEHQHR